MLLLQVGPMAKAKVETSRRSVGVAPSWPSSKLANQRGPHILPYLWTHIWMCSIWLRKPASIASFCQVAQRYSSSNFACAFTSLPQLWPVEGLQYALGNNLSRRRSLQQASWTAQTRGTTTSKRLCSSAGLMVEASANSVSFPIQLLKR